MSKGLALPTGTKTPRKKRGKQEFNSDRRGQGTYRNTLAEVPDMKITLHRFHLVVTLKPRRKLNCLPEGPSTVFLSGAWAECVLSVKVVIFPRGKQDAEDF